MILQHKLDITKHWRKAYLPDYAY